MTVCRTVPCVSLQDLDGRPTDVRVQQDADEFLALLLDRLESALKQTTHAGVVDTLLGGRVVNQIRGACGHVSLREETFTVLSLAINNCGSLHDALVAHTAKEELSGDNAYACSKCEEAGAERKVDAVKRLLLRSTPPTLLIHLKRFEFNLDTMAKQKLNSR